MRRLNSFEKNALLTLTGCTVSRNLRDSGTSVFSLSVSSHCMATPTRCHSHLLKKKLHLLLPLTNIIHSYCPFFNILYNNLPPLLSPSPSLPLPLSLSFPLLPLSSLFPSLLSHPQVTMVQYSDTTLISGCSLVYSVKGWRIR